MEYGLPQLKKYPVDTVENIQKCVKYFHHCPENLREELANNVYKASLREGYEIDGNSDLFRYVSFNEELIEEGYMTNAPKLNTQIERNKYNNNQLEELDDIISESCVGSLAIPDVSAPLWDNKYIDMTDMGKEEDKELDYKEKERLPKYAKTNEDNKYIDRIDIAEEKLYKEDASVGETFDIMELLGESPKEVLTEAPKSKKRQEMETLIYNFFNTIDITGKNSEKYKAMFDNMSDEQFNKYMKKFLYDENQNFYLEVLPNKNEPNLKLIKKCADLLKIPLDEYVYYRHDGDKDHPVRTSYKVPVGLILGSTKILLTAGTALSF